MVEQLINRKVLLQIAGMALLVLALGGCGAELVKPVSQSDRSQFASTNNVVVVRYQPTSAYITWGMTGYAVVDWPQDLKEEYLDNPKAPIRIPPGYVIMSRNNVPDPIAAVTADFIDGLKQKTGITQVRMVDQPMPLPISQDFTRYKSQYSEPYVIEVRPEPSLVGWGFTAQVLHTTTYKFNLIAQASIIRQSDSQEIWKGRCFVSGQNDPALNVSFDEMVSKNNAHVQQVVNKGIRDCAHMLVEQYVSAAK